MKIHFDEELKELKNLLLKMGIVVEEMLEKTSAALLERDSTVTFNILRMDKKVDRLEIEIDEAAHHLMAKRQPIAHDLRLITMVLKINSNLERIGDHAVNIAERISSLSKGLSGHQTKLRQMADIARSMLRDSLSSFTEGNAVLAKDVLTRDDEIDRLNYEIYETLQAEMKEKKDEISSDINLIMIAHNFERIADLATNIAEDAIYMEEGRDVRHQLNRSEA